MIPITTVQFGPEVEEEVLAVLRSGNIAQGRVVERFEKAFADLSGVPHAIAVNNGTTALVAALEVFDLEPGDEVVTTPFTFVATLNAILEAGATAVFADIDEDDFALDATAAEAVMTDRSRVLLPVHLFGQTADMGALTKLAESKGLRLLEDSAQAHGATCEGRSAGSFGVGTFSFYATKNITTGEGGIITTADDAIADRLRVLRNQGMRQRYQYEMPGHNYRLTDLQAAVALPQLAHYGEILEARRSNAAWLTTALTDIDGLVAPRVMPGREHVWHQFTVRITEDAPVDRDEFVAKLGEKGVGAGVYYPRLVHDYDAYRDHPRIRVGETPVAERVSKQVVSLPVHPALTQADLVTIADSVREVLAR